MKPLQTISSNAQITKIAESGMYRDDFQFWHSLAISAILAILL
jgi:hypothetical protein